MSLPSEVDINRHHRVRGPAAGLGARAGAGKIPALSAIRAGGRADPASAGRAHTIMGPRPIITFDPRLAAGCIRRTGIPFVKIAERLNFEIDKTRPPVARAEFGRRIFLLKERADFIEALERVSMTAPRRAAKSGPR